jgi:hypothetical protein
MPSDSTKLFSLTRIGFLVSTILFNACTTLAIAYRVFPVIRHGRSDKPSEIRAGAAVMLLIENGALYTVVGIIFLVLTVKANFISATIFRLVWQVMPVRNVQPRSPKMCLTCNCSCLGPHWSYSGSRWNWAQSPPLVRTRKFRRRQRCKAVNLGISVLDLVLGQK